MFLRPNMCTDVNKMSNWSPYKMQFYESCLCNISESEMYIYHTSLPSNTIVRMKVFQTKSVKRCGVAIFAFSARGTCGTSGRCKVLSKSNH